MQIANVAVRSAKSHGSNVRSAQHESQTPVGALKNRRISCLSGTNALSSEARAHLRTADRTGAPYGGDAVLPESARSPSFCPPPRRGGDGQLLLAASRQSLGDFPVILRNSRLKFDRVLNPLESMAVVTASPASRLSQALSIRNPLT